MSRSLVFEKCSIKELSKEFDASEKLLNDLTDKLEEWLELQPHLPNDVSRKRLEWMILGSKMSLEQAKEKLDNYYTMRKLVPELFADRDPRSADLTSLHESIQYVTLPRLTSEKYRICILRPTVNDASKFNPWILHKYMFMMGDIRMVEDRSAGDIFVYDFSTLSLNHLKHITPAFIKKCEMVARKAYAIRVKGIHCVNAPPLIDRITGLIRSVIKPKLAERIHVHQIGNLESFYKFVPRSLLPKEYGGDYCTMKELSDIWKNKVDEWRDWFLEQNEIFVDERLRLGPAVGENDSFGFSGSFRKLEFD